MRILVLASHSHNWHHIGITGEINLQPVCKAISIVKVQAEEVRYQLINITPSARPSIQYYMRELVLLYKQVSLSPDHASFHEFPASRPEFPIPRQLQHHTRSPPCPCPLQMDSTTYECHSNKCSSWFKDSLLAAIARDSYGLLVAGRAMKMTAPSAMAAEALAIRQATYLANTFPLQDIFISSDFQDVINSLR